MTVLARDAVASDHLVYAWPFPIGPECEVSCAEDEQVVMCPAWLVGDRLGPGRHRWRTPDPSRPVGAFFVLTAPVEVSFDMITSFLIPTTGMPVRLRASGSLQVRCADPGLLIAQFVGLPFDQVNDGVLRSVARSVERMLARLLTRRTVMAGTPLAVTDPGMLSNIIEELVAYNPTAGAVFGVELIRMGHLVIVADDGSTPYLALPATSQPWQQPAPPAVAAQPCGPRYKRPATPVMETIRGMPAVSLEDEPPPPPPRAIMSQASITPPPVGNPVATVSGEIGARSPAPVAPPTGNPVGAVSGEIGVRKSTPAITPTAGNPTGAISGEIGARAPSAPAAAPSTGNPVGAVSGEIGARKSSPAITPSAGNPVMAVSGEITPRAPAPPPPAQAPRTKSTLPPPLPSLRKQETRQADDETLRGVGGGPIKTLPSSGPEDATRPDNPVQALGTPSPQVAPRGAIMGVGMSAIGATPVHGAAVGEIGPKISPGQRVLVPGPNGLMQSATVRQLLQGYYELEVGSSGETIWVPVNGVIPEQA